MTWGLVASAAITVVGGAISGSKAAKAKSKQDQYAQELADWQNQGKQGAYDAYAGEVDDLAGQYGDYAMRPGGVNNGVGQSFIDPVTGEASFALNEEYQGIRDGMLGGSQRWLDEANSTDMKGHAKGRYDQAQMLLAQGDAQAESGLMMDLYNKGGFGLQTNRRAAPMVDADGNIVAGTGNVGVNPYVGTFMDRRNARNADLSYRSMGEAERYVDGLVSRSRGMLGTGMDIDRAGYGSVGAGMDARTTFNSGYKDYLELLRQGSGARRDGMLARYGHVPQGIDPGFGLNQQSQMWRTGADTVNGMLSQMRNRNNQQTPPPGGSQPFDPYGPNAGNEPLYY